MYPSLRVCIKPQPEHKTTMLDKILLLFHFFPHILCYRSTWWDFTEKFIFSVIATAYPPYDDYSKSRAIIRGSHIHVLSRTLGISVTLHRDAINPMYSSWPCIWMKTWLVSRNQRWKGKGHFWPYWTLRFLKTIAGLSYSRVALYMRIEDSCFLMIVVPQLAALL